METMVIIERPIGEVFGFVVDLSNIPSIDPSVQSVEKTSEGPIETGTTFRMRQKAPPLGRVREATVRYTAIEPDRKVEFEAMVGPISPIASLTFEQANGATKVTFRGEPNPVGPLKVLAPLISRQGQRVWEKRLARLKSALETPEGRQPQEEEDRQRQVAVVGAGVGGVLMLGAAMLALYLLLFRRRRGARSRWS